METSDHDVYHHEEALIRLAVESNEKLTTAGDEITSKAFNLGFSVGLAPVGLCVIIAIIATKGSWVAAVITAALLLIALLGFASLAANVSRSNTIERIYREQVQKSIERCLAELQIEPADFVNIATKNLPNNAVLLRFLVPEKQ
jgi:hypothetical protein